MEKQRVNGVKTSEQIFREWVHEHSDNLFLYARKRLPDEETARDLVQETYLAAWRNLDGYKGETSVKSWLHIILKSKIIDQYRRMARRTSTESVNEPEDPFFDEQEHWKNGRYPVGWTVQFEDPVEAKQFRLVLKGCSGKLKEMQQAVFIMKYMDEMDSEQICDLLSISNSNYWVLMHRAKVHLRACLEKNWLNK
jgi:RNA polymerase sigma-70 factor (ECF subfamily)